jgi:hypothetical protein
MEERIVVAIEDGGYLGKPHSYRSRHAAATCCA